MTQSWIQRFWAKVHRTDTCWVWTGGNNGFGHGRFWRLGRLEGSHRVSYELCVGPIPQGMQVLHHCDNPKCVRPEHLFIGTAADNIHDMLAKGRGVQMTKPEALSHPGEQHPGAKVSQKQVAEIRKRYAAGGVNQTALGREFDLSQTQISNIVRQKQWRAS